MQCGIQRAAREPAQNNGCRSLEEMVGSACTPCAADRMYCVSLFTCSLPESFKNHRHEPIS
jgi:hypothetical protein